MRGAKLNGGKIFTAVGCSFVPEDGSFLRWKRRRKVQARDDFPAVGFSTKCTGKHAGLGSSQRRIICTKEKIDQIC